MLVGRLLLALVQPFRRTLRPEAQKGQGCLSGRGARAQRAGRLPSALLSTRPTGRL